MQSAQKKQNQFYQAISKLFYAIAAADREVRAREVNQMRQIISKEWLPMDAYKDEFGSDAAFQVEIAFDWLEEESPDVKSCFDEFRLFKKQHEVLFTPAVNALILKTGHAIASAFSGQNKAEMSMLNELEKLLGKHR